MNTAINANPHLGQLILRTEQTLSNLLSSIFTFVDNIDISKIPGIRNVNRLLFSKDELLGFCEEAMELPECDVDQCLESVFNRLSVLGQTPVNDGILFEVEMK